MALSWRQLVSVGFIRPEQDSASTMSCPDGFGIDYMIVTSFGFIGLFFFQRGNRQAGSLTRAGHKHLFESHLDVSFSLRPSSQQYAHGNQ